MSRETAEQYPFTPEMLGRLADACDRTSMAGLPQPQGAGSMGETTASAPRCVQCEQWGRTVKLRANGEVRCDWCSQGNRPAPRGRVGR